MKNILCILYFLISCMVFGQKESSKTIKINEDWKFIQKDIPDAEKTDYNDTSWESVNLPHDWSISKSFSKENPSFSRGAWLPAGVSYYRKALDLPKLKEGQKVFIYFEGAYRNAEVWCNGNYLGKRPSGYASFEYEITHFIQPKGKNVITVKLDNSSQPHSRWYSGNGIYRDVFLKIKNAVYIPTWATKVTSEVADNDSAKIHVTSLLKNTSNISQQVNFETHVKTGKHGIVSNAVSVTIPANSEKAVENAVVINNPTYWELDNPHLYYVKTYVFQSKKTIAHEEIPTGIRTLRFDANEGFFLNGEALKIQGVCLHHGAGPLGAAARKTSYQRQIRKLKEMGVNAVRTAHNPFATAFLDTCDEMGMLVMNEAFDEWEVAKNPATFRENGAKIPLPVDYYASIFKDWSDRDMTDFVLRDRNHPSVFMWSIGNEIEQMHHESGVAIAKRLQDIVHKLDDTRPATCGVNGYGWNKWPHEPAISVMDIPGYNYADPEDYDKEHKDFPDRKMIVTEHNSAQAFTARGEYYPFKGDSLTFQVDLPIEHPNTKRFLKNRRAFDHGMEAWRDVAERAFVMGSFIWTGWDYLGETIPYPWPARSSSFGVIDLAGFPKDGYYYYESQWTEKPVLHIFPHWNWKGNEGKPIKVYGFSNLDEVELIVNGQSLGKQQVDIMASHPLEWQAIYQPGRLKAIGYKNGKVVLEKILETTGEATKTKSSVTDKGNDGITYVEIDLLDEKSRFIPTANNLLHFEVQHAEIIGVANGNNRSIEPFVANYRKAFNGKVLVVLKKNNPKKDASLKVSIETSDFIEELKF